MAAILVHDGINKYAEGPMMLMMCGHRPGVVVLSLGCKQVPKTRLPDGVCDPGALGII